MKRTITTGFLLVVLSICCFSQTKPAAPPRPASQTPTTPSATNGGSKVGVIDMQGAISGTNEGQRDFAALAKKFEPRRTELQKQNTEIEDLKKQLSSQGDKMAPDAKDALVKSIDTKTKALQRSAEDAQNEFQQQQNEIAQRILQKLGPVISKYVDEHGYGVLLDASVPWPQGPVVMANRTSNITKAVVDAYNVQSGIAAPATAKPAAPAAPPTKP